MKLLVFAASHRADSYNRKLAKIAEAHLRSQRVDIDFAEYAEFDMPLYNDAIATGKGVPDIAHSFVKRAAKTDGIVICSPEYNWSYPGSLKNIIDWTSRLKPSPLAGKTALLVSATPGSRGGILGLEHLKSPLAALQLHVFPKVFPLGYSEQAFNGDALANKKQEKNFTALLDDFVTFTRKLV